MAKVSVDFRSYSGHPNDPKLSFPLGTVIFEGISKALDSLERSGYDGRLLEVVRVWMGRCDQVWLEVVLRDPSNHWFSYGCGHKLDDVNGRLSGSTSLDPREIEITVDKVCQWLCNLIVMLYQLRLREAETKLAELRQLSWRCLRSQSTVKAG